jgi:hypothetical protein
LNIARLLTVLAAVLSFAVVGVSSASATTSDQCQAKLSDLRAHTVAAQDAFTNVKDFDGAVAKLDAASSKLSDGKNDDAVKKLRDFQTQLNSLATAPKEKLDPATAQQLIAEAQGVIDCINAIGTT